MKRIILLFTSLFILNSIECQKFQVKYYDKNWYEVEQEFAEYYSHIFKTKDSLGNRVYKVIDYYSNNFIQMIGYYKSLNPKVRHGSFVWYYKNGNISTKANFRLDLYDGIYKNWHENGQLKTLCRYVNNKIDGTYWQWYETGQLKKIANYKNDKLNGEFIVYYENGNLLRKEEYSDGNFVSGKCYSKSGADTTFYAHIIQPTYEGGIDAFRDYIESNLEYPICGIEKGLTGRVIVDFTVELNGSISNPKISLSDHECFNRTALDLILSSPAKWIPGQIDGVETRMSMRFPIVFLMK